MSWENGQKAVVKRYQKYAALSDFDYRRLLLTTTGQRTSTAQELSQGDFDVFMAVLEVTLWERFGQGLCDRPPAGIQPDYWQRRCPAAGMANSRHLHLIGPLYQQLVNALDAANQSPVDPPRYLLQMASRASRRPIHNLSELRAWDAVSLIEAIKDRLRGLGVDTRAKGWTQGRTRRRARQTQEQQQPPRPPRQPRRNG